MTRFVGGSNSNQSYFPTSTFQRVILPIPGDRGNHQLVIARFRAVENSGKSWAKLGGILQEINDGCAVYEDAAPTGQIPDIQAHHERRVIKKMSL